MKQDELISIKNDLQRVSENCERRSGRLSLSEITEVLIEYEESEDNTCENCRWINCSEYDEHCVGCIHNAMEKFEPMPKYTNADKIRAMSDEELAFAIMCPNEMPGVKIPCVNTDCFKCSLDWLKSEAEEGEV